MSDIVKPTRTNEPLREQLKEMIEPLGSWENIYIYKGNRSCGKSYIQSLLDDKDKEIERLTNIIEKAVEYIEQHRKVYKLGVNQETDEFDYISTSPQVLLNILNGKE